METPKPRQEFGLPLHSIYDFKEGDIRASIPVFDIGALLEQKGGFSISLAQETPASFILRLQNLQGIDATLKINKTDQFPDEEGYPHGFLETVANLISSTDTYIDQDYWDLRCYRQYHEEYTQDGLALAYVAGHLIGHQQYPNNIDPPLALWGLNTADEKFRIVGYSTPYVEGQAVKISEYPEIDALADRIEEATGIYLGHRGMHPNMSRTAVVKEDGTVKFINVKLRPHSARLSTTKQ